jgi:MinD-like ATPase involved in chromosome partitioning or flagellar assembly
MESNRGRIVTFYSHKGGTGRSMALANVACLLSRRSDVTRVLMVDWDLDAPGLHCFFPSPGPSPDAQGLIDLVQRLDRKVQGASREPLDEESAAQLFEDIQLQDFVSSTDVDGVYLMAAGRFDEGYGERVSTFNWRGLFQRAPTLIRNFAEFVGSQYDYVLVDSRTGFNDISGICTSLLPDQLVLVFTPNRQSLIGGLDTVKRAARYRLQSDDIRPLSILPLPSRIDVSEPELMEKWRFGDPEKGEDERGYQIRFEEAFKEIYGLTSCDLENYFDDVQIQHVPRYSYGEKIAARRERGTRLSLSRSYATFTDILARQESPWDRLRSAQGGAELVADDSPTAVKIQAVKDYLPEERHRLKLFDLFTNEMRDALPRIKSLGLNEHPTAESFARRLRDYESIFSDLIRMQVLVGYWGEWYTRPLLGLGAKRVCDQYSAQSGLTVWLATRFYPATLLM